MMDRRTLLAGAVSVLAAPSVSRAQAKPKLLRFVPQADLALLDPIQSFAFVTRNHACLVFDTLYGLDADYRPQPQMVAGHVVEDEGRRWVLTLRSGLLFHDGTPVLARDVVASIRRWASVDSYGASLLAATDDLTAPSDGQVTFRLKRPFRLLPDVLGKPAPAMPVIMPERLARLPGQTAVPEIVGSGPFRFLDSERVPGSSAAYARFDGYKPREGSPSFMAGSKLANFDRVEWHTLPDPATAAAALQAGEVDWWEQATPDLLPTFRKRADIKVEILEETGYIAVLRFNHVQPPFDNRRSGARCSGPWTSRISWRPWAATNRRLPKPASVFSSRTRRWPARPGWRP